MNSNDNYYNQSIYKNEEFNMRRGQILSLKKDVKNQLKKRKKRKRKSCFQR